MKNFLALSSLSVLFVILGGSISYGQPEAGVCARVRIRIVQDAILTRNGFEAILEIDNNSPDLPLENISIELTVIDEDGNIALDKFSIAEPTLSQFDISNNQVRLNPGVTGRASWIIIPNSEAAPEGPTLYYVQGTVLYTLEGQNITFPLFPDDIWVHPEPRLQIDYFHERDVFSDDPFTEEIEPPVPFNLGVMVHNLGKGVAIDMSITSAQPQIIENEKGLLINFNILSTQVGLNEVSLSLTAHFGDIDPGETAVANWALTASLQGKFIEYQATFEHTSSLGDEKLSLIDSVNIHEAIHQVRIDRPQDDLLPDYLVNDLGDDDLPEQIFTSQGFQIPVSTVLQANVAGAPFNANNLSVEVNADMPSGWVYLRFDNPAGKEFPLAHVVRDDGYQPIMDYNVWTTYRIRRPLGAAPYVENFIHILDFDSSGNYTLTYEVQNEQPTPIPTPTYRVVQVPTPALSTPTPTQSTPTPTPTVTPTPLRNNLPNPIFVSAFQSSNSSNDEDLLTGNDLFQVNGTFVNLEHASIDVIMDDDVNENVLKIDLNPSFDRESGTFILLGDSTPSFIDDMAVVRVSVKTEDRTAKIYAGLIDTDETGGLLEINDYGKAVGSTLGMESIVVSENLIGDWITLVVFHRSETGFVKPFIQVTGNNAGLSTYFHKLEVFSLAKDHQLDSGFFGMNTGVLNQNFQPDYINSFNKINNQSIDIVLAENDIFPLRGTLANLNHARVEISNNRFWEGHSLQFEILPVDGNASGTLVFLSNDAPIPVPDKAIAKVLVRSSDPSNQIYFGLIDSDQHGNLVGTLGMDSLLNTTQFSQDWGMLSVIHKSNTGYVKPFIQVANDLRNAAVWFDNLEVYVIKPGDIYDAEMFLPDF